MFVAKGKTYVCSSLPTEDGPTGSEWTYQTNGWMNDELGELWFEEVFHDNCGEGRPQILILDGHSSHKTLAILMCAMENNISLLSLTPHTTHMLQSLDK